MRMIFGLVCALGVLTNVAAAGADTFVTLGTQGGPLAQPARSQPANALVRDDGAIILVDAGDGAAEQLAKAHLPLAKVDTIFLSHMHFDHTAGVLGILALRFQLGYPGTVTVYGPPGSAAFVNGLLDAMKPFEMSGFGVPGERIGDPRDGVKVVEITDGSVIMVGNIKVTAAQNTHYTFSAGSDLDRHFKSLAYRFDMANRSIVYTGDTGPSANVEKLAKGADILISEIIDIDKIVAIMRRDRPDLGAEQMKHLEEHQRTQHLPAEAVGQMARAAGVKAVVLTHIVPGNLTPTDEINYRKAIAAYYAGPVTFARDLDGF